MSHPSHSAVGVWVSLAAAGVFLSPCEPARADIQIKDLQKNNTINVLECTATIEKPCNVELKFQIVNTGFDSDGEPDLTKYTIDDVYDNIYDTKSKGDLRNDILKRGSATNNCDGVIKVDEACTVTAMFKIVDNDINDVRQADKDAAEPDAVWYATLNVDYTAGNAKDKTLIITPHLIGILDDPAPAPEPSVWALMVVGLGAVGGAARRARSPRCFPKVSPT